MKYSFLSSVMISVISGVLMLSLDAAPARADFKLCNGSGAKYLAAVTWTSTNGVRSVGWIQLQPKECSPTILPGSVAGATIGVYGQNTGGGFTTGSTKRCVIQFPTQRTWDIRGADDASRCTGRGRVMVGFDMVRPTDSNFTYVLSD